jgi:hypothetical protein
VAHGRAQPIRDHDHATRNFSLPGNHARWPAGLASEVKHPGLRVEGDAAIPGQFIDEERIKLQTSHAEAKRATRVGRKWHRRWWLATQTELNSAEGRSTVLNRLALDAKLAQNGAAAGHQPLTARLVPWKRRLVEDGDLLAGTSRKERGRRAGRSRADHDHIDSWPPVCHER